MSDTAVEDKKPQSIDRQAARQLATTTKTVPQMAGVTPRWILRLLPWVQVDSGTYRVNRKRVILKGPARLAAQIENGEARIRAEDLQSLPLLEHATPEAIGALAERFASEQCAAGEAVVTEGDAGDKFYVIARGKLEVTTTGSQDETLRVALLADGDHFGEIALLRNTPRTATVRALTPCVLLALSKADFDGILDGSPGLREDLESGVEERMRRLADVDEHGEQDTAAHSASEGETALPEIFLDYEDAPLEFPLNALQTIVQVHTRVSDIYNQPINQLREQLRLAIEGLKEKQEWDIVNHGHFGLLNQAERPMRVQPRRGPPTPDDMDELLSRVWKKPAYFLAHPRAIAAFGRECTRRGVPPVVVHMFGSPFITWRGVPIVPSNKLEINGSGRGASIGTSNILLMRVGEQEQGVVGLHQTGIPGEQSPSLSVRFMGINASSIASYLVTLYSSAAVLTPDALGVLENVEVGFWHDYE